MFRDKAIEIWSPGERVDLGGGVFTQGEYTKVKELMVDVQPYSKAQAYHEYGLDIDVTNTIFSPVISIVPGIDIIKYLGYEYDVMELVIWDEYIEILVNRRK